MKAISGYKLAVHAVSRAAIADVIRPLIADAFLEQAVLFEEDVVQLVKLMIQKTDYEDPQSDKREVRLFFFIP